MTRDGRLDLSGLDSLNRKPHQRGPQFRPSAKTVRRCALLFHLADLMFKRDMATQMEPDEIGYAVAAAVPSRVDVVHRHVAERHVLVASAAATALALE